MHLGQIPTCIAHPQTMEMAVGVGHFEAARVDDHRTVAGTLSPRVGSRERQAQRGAIGTVAHHGRARQKARKRRLASLTVSSAVVLILTPRLRGFVELLEGEI